ncbi:hypothetical protein [Nostoc sp.]|uniref:hypothetical protein n=1 Tax=Nostoc sp. TaxID=1180 RepID=UPI002FF9DAE7
MSETDIQKLLRLQDESYQRLKESLGLEGKSQIELLAISLALIKLATEAEGLAGHKPLG